MLCFVVNRLAAEVLPAPTPFTLYFLQMCQKHCADAGTLFYGLEFGTEVGVRLRMIISLCAICSWLLQCDHHHDVSPYPPPNPGLY